MSVSERILRVPYSTWKQVVDNNGFQVHHQEESDDSRTVWAGNYDHVYQASVDADDFITTYSGAYNGSAIVVSGDDDAVAHIVGLSQIYEIPRTTDRRPRIAVEKPDSTKITLYSHNWCDTTSWYEKAVRVVDEGAVDSGDHQIYNLTNSGIIDTYHGKTMQEDFLTDSGGNSFRVAVTVDDVLKTEQDPHHGTGGDYTVDYVGGQINFVQTLSGTETVGVTYHYANSATYTIEAAVGKNLIIDAVEVQLSADHTIEDTVRFQPYGYVDYFAPHLVPDYLPPGTKIPLGNPLVFKGISDYLCDANKAWPAYPAGLGGDSWRGMSQPIYIFTWDYVTATTLYGSAGMEIRVELEHDKPFGGTYASVAFYCRTEDE